MKMIFPFEIKHNSEYFSPNKEIEVDEKDVKELIQLGGKVVEKPTPPSPVTKRVSKK